MYDAAGSGDRRDTFRGRVPGIIVFVVADTASFLLLFAVFMGERIAHIGVFTQSAALLDVRLGLLNTLILITSGWLVASAAQTTKRGNHPLARIHLDLAIVIACIFGINKALEYTEKLNEGISPATNEFFSFYFILTGLHFVHYLVGLGALMVAATKLQVSASTQPPIRWLESAALYWHMVDLLWIFLYPMLYLQSR